MLKQYAILEFFLIQMVCIIFLSYSHSSFSSELDCSDPSQLKPLQRNKCSKRGDDPRNPEGDNFCTTEKAEIAQASNKLLENCTCDSGQDDGGDEFQNCLITACTKNCEAQIYEQIYRCDEVKQNLQSTCSTQCTPDYLYTPDNDIGQSKQVCADENKETIASELEKSCNDNYPDGLICPDGDSRKNHNCQQVCQNEAAKTANNISNKCGDITTAKGFGCLNDSASETQAALLPRNPNQLPKGFRWESCALEMPCDHTIQDVFDTALQECKDFKQKALRCCGKDLSKCKANSGTELFKNTGSITMSCQKMKEASDNMNSLVQKINNQCQSDSASCVQSCSTKIANQVQPLFLNTCNFDLDKDKSYKHGEHTCSEGLINKYTDYYANKLFPVLSECSSLGAKSHEHTQAATEELFKTSFSSANCAEQASGGIRSDSKPEPEQQATNAATPTAMDVWKQTGGSIFPSANNTNNTNKSSSLRWNPNKKSFERLIKNTSEGGGGSSASKRSQDARSPSATPAGSSAKPHQNQKEDIKAGSNNKKMGQNNKNSASLHINQANANVGGERNKSLSLLLSDKQKDKTQGKVTDREKQDKNSLRQFAKTNGRKQNARQISWRKIKPRNNLNTKISSFGSSHDNIFERISNRISFMCKTEKLVDCKK